jgi:Cytochrome C oxidase, cbb3-type, subunit III
MRALRKPLTIAVAASALAVGITSGIYAQGGDWKAPADAKSVKNPLAAKKNDPKLLADWTSSRVASEADGEIFWKMSNGRGAMPPWKHLPEDQRWALVNYIRSLQAKK